LNADYEIHAATDVSDGLARDLAHIIAESGCGAEIDLDRVPISPDARQAAVHPEGVRTPLDHALSDGEDFELILAVPAGEADRLLADQPLDVPLTRIGRFCENPGLWQRAPGRAPTPLRPVGYEH
jgi:thiamine-monophosphate kinase